MKWLNLICNLGLYSAICRIRDTSQNFFLRWRSKTLVSRVCRNEIVNKIKKYISKVAVGFVKSREWCLACNCPWTACPRKSAVPVAFEVARTVFVVSQLYRHLSALSVLSRYCWVVHACWLSPAILCDTMLMLFPSTAPLGDCVCVVSGECSVGCSWSIASHQKSRWAVPFLVLTVTCASTAILELCTNELNEYQMGYKRFQIWVVFFRRSNIPSFLTFTQVGSCPQVLRVSFSWVPPQVLPRGWMGGLGRKVGSACE